MYCLQYAQCPSDIIAPCFLYQDPWWIPFIILKMLHIHKCNACSLHTLLTFDPCCSFPGRPIPSTSSSSLLPSAQLPSSHNPPPVGCQMPLLDSNTSHQIMDTNPDEEFSPNSYLLRACSGSQQPSSSGKNLLSSSK